MTWKAVAERLIEEHLEMSQGSSGDHAAISIGFCQICGKSINVALTFFLNLLYSDNRLDLADRVKSRLDDGDSKEKVRIRRGKIIFRSSCAKRCVMPVSEFDEMGEED